MNKTTRTLPLGKIALVFFAVAAVVTFYSNNALAHAIAQGDKGYIQQISGTNIGPFMYLGAKHMVTGYDHILFLVGVIFFLFGFNQIATYVTLFAVGHSVTMLIGVYFNFGINPHIIDAIIGFSVVYKALDNLGAFQLWFGFQPNTKVMTFIFGLLHGFGLASKILDYEMSSDGLVPNLLAFNVGVELGQLVALGLILLFMHHWRATASFMRQAYAANFLLMTAGFFLIGIQCVAFLADHS